MEAILPNFKILIIQILTFALGMWAIWKLYISSLRDHLRQRREGIAKDLASAETARQEAEHLRAQLHADRARMAEDLKQAREEAKAEVARLREELLLKARAEQEALLKQGRTLIASELAQAAQAVRLQAAELVVQATGKLLQKKVDSASDKAMARKLVAAARPSRPSRN